MVDQYGGGAFPYKYFTTRFCKNMQWAHGTCRNDHYITMKGFNRTSNARFTIVVAQHTYNLTCYRDRLLSKVFSASGSRFTYDISLMVIKSVKGCKWYDYEVLSFFALVCPRNALYHAARTIYTSTTIWLFYLNKKLENMVRAYDKWKYIITEVLRNGLLKRLN